MTDNELLLAISDLMDKKLKPVNDRLAKIELTQADLFRRDIHPLESAVRHTVKIGLPH